MQDVENTKKKLFEKNEQMQETVSLSSESAASLLSVLDDKNRAIENLQQQLQNQKLQLAYYIRNALTSSKIIQFSKTCKADTIDNNIPLTLALNNFCKQTGMKSRLMVLYERMSTTDDRIQNIISKQELLLQEIVNKIGNTFITDFNKSNQKNLIFSHKQQFEMLSEIFQTTVGLKLELERYRLCCNKVISIEDERNLLVEQVYSLPVEDRTRCNYILVIQMEKNLLEKEMKCIRFEQKQLQMKLRQLKIIEKGLREVQLNSTGDNNFGTKLIEELSFLSADAQALLSISQKFKNNCDERMENKALEGESKVTASKYVEEIQEKDKEIEKLKMQLEVKAKENESLQQTIAEFKSEINQLETARISFKEDIESLQMERDNYKSQVDNLEAIRKAYFQLVEQQSEMEAQLASEEKKLEEHEVKYERLLFETKRLKELNTLQVSNIKHLLKIIDKLAKFTNVGETSEAQYSTTIVQTAETKKNYSDSLTQTHQHNRELVHKNTKLDESIPQMSTTTFELERINKQGKMEKLKAILQSTSSVHGIVHLNETNSLSLEVNCKRTKSTIDDEYELMKDCSYETMPNICALKNSESDRKGSISDEDFGWEDEQSPTPSMEMLLKSCDVNFQDADKLSNVSEIEGDNQQDFNQLVCINENLKLISSGIDNVLMEPEGKESLTDALHEMYESVLKN